MKIVIFGLTVSSSWGNGHATLWRGLIRALAARADAGESVAEAAETLFDLARVQDGEAPRDPAAFARRVTEALAGAA